MSLAFRTLLPVVSGFALREVNDFLEHLATVFAPKIMQSETLVVRNLKRPFLPSRIFRHGEAVFCGVPALSADDFFWTIFLG